MIKLLFFLSTAVCSFFLIDETWKIMFDWFELHTIFKIIQFLTVVSTSELKYSLTSLLVHESLEYTYNYVSVST